MTVDKLTAMVQLLLSYSDVTSIVGQNVFGGKLPRGVIDDMEDVTKEVHAVVVRPGGGGGDDTGYSEYGRANVVINCYAPTPYEASLLTTTIYKRLKHVIRTVPNNTDTLIHSITPVSKEIQQVDPDVHVPYSMTVWEVNAAEVPITT